MDDYFLSGAYQVFKYAAKWSLLALRGLKEENFNMMYFKYQAEGKWLDNFLKNTWKIHSLMKYLSKYPCKALWNALVRKNEKTPACKWLTF